MDHPYRFARLDTSSGDADPVFQRLTAIRHAVESGVADAETLAQWDDLRAGVLDLVETLRARPIPVSHADAQRFIRIWIGEFADKHWPSTAFH